jgi:hypothetical protein
LDRHLNEHDTQTVRTLVAEYGLRPVVNAVGAAALALLQTGQPVKDADGDPMDEGEIETAAHNLIEGSLY